MPPAASGKKERRGGKLRSSQGRQWAGHAKKGQPGWVGLGWASQWPRGPGHRLSHLCSPVSPRRNARKGIGSTPVLQEGGRLPNTSPLETQRSEEQAKGAGTPRPGCPSLVGRVHRLQAGVGGRVGGGGGGLGRGMDRGLPDTLCGREGSALPEGPGGSVSIRASHYRHPSSRLPPRILYRIF